jgi:hypothetical protein
MFRRHSLLWIALLSIAAPAASPATVVGKISNQKVVVTEETLAPGENASLSGNRPGLLVFFSGDAVELVVHGVSRRELVKRGDTLFLTVDEHSIKNVGSSKLSFVRTEFLTDGNPETWGMTGLAPNYKIILENQYARAYNIKIPAQHFEPQHTHHDRIVICLSGAQLEHILPSGEKQPSTLKSGDIAWRPGATHIGHNMGQTNLWVIAIEPK